MRRFNPATSILAGMDNTVLQTNLNNLQQAYIDLSTGAKGETYSYTQGDGAKAVTYTRTNIGALVQAIELLQAQLGITTCARRPINLIF
jgi:gpW